MIKYNYNGEDEDGPVPNNNYGWNNFGTSDYEAQKKHDIQPQEEHEQIGLKTGEMEDIAGMAGMDPMVNIAMQIKGAIDSLPDWYSIEHKNEDPTAVRAIYGSSAGSPGLRFLQGHSADMAAARQNIEANTQDYSNVKNNANLLNAWDSNGLQGNINYNFGWSNVADVWTNSIKEPLGGVTSILSQIGGKTRAESLNNAINRANTATINSFYNTARNNSARSQREALMHYAAFGGPLSQLNSFYSNNGVEKFNVGGSHEQNPNEGIQQGIAPDGYPNLVEEGEVKYKDYIYSKRIKPTKTLLKKNNLPEKYHGLSYAEIAEKLQKESEMRPNDPVSISTLNSWMDRLQSAQEETKAINEARRAAKFVDSLSDQDKMGLLAMMQQQDGQEMPQEAMPQQEPMIMADGGQIYIKPENRGKFTELKERTGHSATWFKEHGTPAQKKMATFALNTKHWDHSKADGGHLFDGESGSSYLKYPLNQYNQKFGTNLRDLETAYVKALQTEDSTDVLTALGSAYIGAGGNPEVLDYLDVSYDRPLTNDWRSFVDFSESNIKDPELTRVDKLRNMLGLANVTNTYSPLLKSNQFTPNVSEYVSDPAGRKYGKFNSFEKAFQGNAVDENGSYTDEYKNWVNGLSNNDIDTLLKLSIVSPDTKNYETLESYLNRMKGDRDIYQTFKELSLDQKYAQQHGFLNSLRLPERGEFNIDYPNTPVYQDYSGLPAGIGKPRNVNPENKSDFDKSYWDEENQRWIYRKKSDYVPKEEVKPKDEIKPKDKKKISIDWDKLQDIGDIGLILASAFGPDYRYANQLRQLAGQYNPVAAPSLGGYRRYTPYDINLGDAENIAMQAAALRANAGQNRATQAAQDLAVLNQYQKAAAARNLEWQKANEANRLATDTYNLGIDEKNLAMIQAYDTLNSNIKDKRLDMLARGAKAEDDASTLWSQGLSTSVTNFLDNMDARRREKFANDMYEKYLAQHAPVKFMLQNND